MNWIPIEECLPDDEEAVLIWTADGEPWTGYLGAGRWRYMSGELITFAPVTHWMPFPEGPQS